MWTTSRRALLGAAAASIPVVYLASTATAGDLYSSNTDLYRDLSEGVDFERRLHRHEVTSRTGAKRTTILAPHGGGIELGTSELCLAIAGYHPATLAAAGQLHDYWMFEGVRPTNNDELHVTSAHCDDHMARSLCSGSLNALGLHGCTASAAGFPSGAAGVLVGGRNATFRQKLVSRLSTAGFTARDGVNHPTLSGTDPANICNRTLTASGAQLEITTPLRSAMFTNNTASGRKTSTTSTFWTFVNAVRAAIADVEASQQVL
ncbi:poly-gamma-glutamate hydrolase family protein [Nocardioides speluncae]|uniref:poly-gamma-glutamate hydrolase family protein n=1 Tax=Nocardioides speluncae TaxID=2670337 RepID=UPI000D68FC41|nr:poly-gamma-glutamate hydrolase family protein [Nocardioides speluncae]